MSSILFGNRIRFDFDPRGKCTVFEIADLPDIKKLSKVRFSNATFSDREIVNGQLPNNKVMFTNPRYSYSDIEFFDLNGKSIESCILIMPIRQVDDYNELNRGYNTDIYPQNGRSALHRRPPNIRMIGSPIPYNYVTYISNYLRIYIIKNADVQIIGKKLADYHIVDQPNCAEVISLNSWLSELSITDYTDDKLVVVVYDGIALF